jgi:hypothetical protein
MKIYADSTIEIHRAEDGTVRIVQVLATFSAAVWIDFVAAMTDDGATAEKIAEVRAVHERAVRGGEGGQQAPR